MDYGFPLGAKEVIFTILLSLLSGASILAQSENAKKQISFSYDQAKISSLISDMEMEHESKRKKISELVKSKRFKATENKNWISERNF